MPEIKSGKVLEDQDEIYRFLTERALKQPTGAQIRTHPEEGFLVIPNEPTGVVCDKRLHLPQVDELQRLVAERGMPWQDTYATRFEMFWTSDERVDGDGDIVRQNWDFSRYEKLSRVLHAHNWSGLPVGRSVLWEVKSRKDGDFSGPALFQIFLFATEDQNPMAGVIRNLVAARFLTETSVGFLPLKIIHVEDEEERERLNLGRWGVVFERSKLIETSTCAVACNEGAHVLNSLTRAKEAGGLKVGDLDLVRSLVAAQSVAPSEYMNGYDTTIVDVFRELFPEETFKRPVTVTLESLQDQLNELKEVQASTTEELIGWFNNLQSALVDLYPKVETTPDAEDEDDEADGPLDEDLDDLDDDDEDSDTGLEDDDDEDEPAESDPPGRSQPVGTSYLDGLFGDDE